MDKIIYSATGCIRCKIARQFLEDHGITCHEKDALAEDREAFKAFYKHHRAKIYRGPEGIEFPILMDGEVICQGLPMVLGHLIRGPALDGFFKPGTLHGEWIDGIQVSGGNATYCEDFLTVLNYLKKQQLKLQIETNGINADLLERVLHQQLADRVIMELPGPLEIYESLLQQPFDPAEIKKSIALVAACDDYCFTTTFRPFLRKNDGPTAISTLTPDEVAEIALLIKEVTGSSTQPYRLQVLGTQAVRNSNLQPDQILTPADLLAYRNKARKFQFKTEIASH